MFDDEEFMEFLWHNGQFVMNKTDDKRSGDGGGATETILIPDDEMASWLTSYPTPAADRGYHAQDYSTTVIGSNEIPDAVEPQLVRALLAAAGDLGTGDSTSTELPPLVPREERKRKGKESRDVESEELEVPEAKKQVHGSPSTKRSRSAQIHNLSERRRRDRINEKMKALRELIPRCNKTDKASLLDEATEYLKSLQQTVQMMSMGYGMVPAVCPRVQQYVPRMPIGMNIEAGTSRPIMPYPLQAPASSEFFGQNFPVPAFNLQAVSSSDQTIAQATSQSDPLLNLHQLQFPSETQISNFHIYQHYLGVHEGPLALSQNQATMQQSRSKPRSISEVQYHDDAPYSGIPANFIV